MKADHTILCNYKFGDIDQRLNLFLTYRNLRKAFIEIDLMDGNPTAKERKETIMHLDPIFCGLEAGQLQKA